MLVLSRQRDETIMIGDEVEITVVDIRGDKVRLGITAPARIAVHRKEVYEAIRAENQAAASNAVAELPAIGTAMSAVSSISGGPSRTGRPGVRALAAPAVRPASGPAEPVRLPEQARKRA
jgi:carbon storage regulator